MAFARQFSARLAQTVVLLFVGSLCTFALMRAAPGDPIHAILRPDEVAITKADEAALRSQLGLDQPVHVQYVMWLKKVIRLDFGTSYITHRPVLDELLGRLPATVALAVSGLAVMVAVTAPLGMLAAVYHHRLIDHVGRLLALLSASLPAFWLGMLLISLFSYRFHLLPSFGAGSAAHLVLPALTLGLSLSGVYLRLLRAGLLEAFGQPYIRAARARGVSEWRIVTRHALRAALLPVVTVFGMSLGSLLGGSVVVETLFSWPGLGKLAVDAIMERDYPLIQGYVVMTSLFVVGVNLLVDLTYRLLDPRIRFGGGAKP